MNSLYRIAPAAALAALLSQPVPAAAETRFTILPRVDPSAEADLNLTRWLNFEADVSLKVRTDPALVPSARVIELVEAIPMISDAGAKGLGELTMVGASAAIANAIRHATGRRIRKLPIRVDDLL